MIAAVPGIVGSDVTRNLCEICGLERWWNARNCHVEVTVVNVVWKHFRPSSNRVMMHCMLNNEIWISMSSSASILILLVTSRYDNVESALKFTLDNSQFEFFIWTFCQYYDKLEKTQKISCNPLFLKHNVPHNVSLTSCQFFSPKNRLFPYWFGPPGKHQSHPSVCKRYWHLGIVRTKQD